jgi:ADP-ribose pyrophosphatase YjhB (NUDIX family)
LQRFGQGNWIATNFKQRYNREIAPATGDKLSDDYIMNYCSHCAQPLKLQIPQGDNRLRHCCSACGAVHYQNPKMVLGTLPVWQDQVLLCKRAIEPSYGLWTLPAGFMENGETIAQGALRETLEEAGAQVNLLGLLSVLDVEIANQVHLYYRAELLNLDFCSGVESLEVRLFKEQEIPWEQLAFPSVSLTLRAYFADRERGQWGLHTGSVDAELVRSFHVAPR